MTVSSHGRRLLKKLTTNTTVIMEEKNSKDAASGLETDVLKLNSEKGSFPRKHTF